jgi:hypothetical protein
VNLGTKNQERLAIDNQLSGRAVCFKMRDRDCGVRLAMHWQQSETAQEHEAMQSSEFHSSLLPTYFGSQTISCTSSRK